MDEGCFSLHVFHVCVYISHYQTTPPHTSRYCIPTFILQRVTFTLVCPGAILAYAHCSCVIVSAVSRLSQSLLVGG